MAASIRTIRAAAITAGGPTQDVTISGFGTPDVVVVKMLKVTTDSVVVPDAGLAVGVFDGTSAVCYYSRSIDNLASSSGGRGNDFGGANFIRTFNHSGTDDSRASVSLITDGVRLDWATLPPAGWLMSFTFIKGTEAAVCGYVDNSGGDVDITALGAQPNFIYTFGSNTGSFPASGFDVTEGYCVESGGVVSQGSMSWFEQHNSSNCSPMVIYSTSESKRDMFGGGLLGGIIWGAFDANGATAQQVAGTGSKSLYLMIKFPAGQEVGLFSDSVTTSTGNTTIGPGGSVVPSFIQGCFAALTPAMDNTWRGSSGDPEAGVISLFAYDGTTQLCNTLFLDEGTDPVSTDSVSKSGAVFDSADDNQANAWVGTASAFTAGGMTVNVTTAPATERRIFGWYIEEASGGGGDDIDGTVAGTGVASGALSADVDASGASAGVSTTAAALSADVEAEGQVAGASDAAGALAADANIAGVTAGIAAAAAQASADAGLEATAAGSGEVSGALLAGASVSGSVDGQADASGAIAADVDASGQADGVAGASGSLAAASDLSGSSAGTSAAVGTIVADANLDGQTNGVAGTSGALESPDLGDIDGASAGAAGATGTLRADAAVTGASNGQSGAFAALSVDADATGQIDGAGGAAGFLVGTGALSGASAGQGATVAQLRANTDAEGQTVGVGAMSGTLASDVAIEGASDGQGAVVGDLIDGSGTAYEIAGTAAGVAVATGTLVTQFEDQAPLDPVRVLHAFTKADVSTAYTVAHVSAASATARVS